jgi:exonuclease III
VGGLKSESERGSGPKISTLRALAREKLDFFVLTETRVDVRAVKKIKLKRNLHATMHSLHPRPRGGVIVFSKKEHKLIPDSVRTSQSPGHFAVGVYEIKTSRVIVAGVYGCSESDDRPSLAIVQDLRDRIQELSHVYHTRTVLLAGDFNATLSQADANNQIISKPNTVQALHTLIEDHQLVDLRANAGCLTHTWHRRDSSRQSSRIDLILTNIPMQCRHYKLTQIIFDHALVHGTINLDRRQITHAMKDFVLGSEEFLIRSQERIEEFFLNRGREEMREDGLGGAPEDAMGNNMDDQYCFDDPLSGQTTMHAFSDLVHDLSALHNEIAKSKAGRVSKTLRETSASLFRLQQKLKGEACRVKRQDMQEEILRLQQTLKIDIQ